MAATTLSIDQYLRNSNFKPDVEYIDGELRARPVVTTAHGKLQSLLSHWFLGHEDWNVDVAVEARMRVSPARVRLPDVVVDYAGDWPDTLIEPPLIVIEILSPNDSYIHTQTLAEDYLAMGVANIWLLDPKAQSARVYENGAWVERVRLEVLKTPIYLDTEKLFARLHRRHSKQEEQQR